MADLLPVHGFVLAGGRSSRMGVDKATLHFHGRPMVEIAVEKLRTFCADVSIAGNREDLSGVADIVHETRMDAGPAAGIEAGLRAARQEWCLFVPVDVPLVPAELLRRWAEDGLRRSSGEPFEGSYLSVRWVDQPTFCFLRHDANTAFTEQLDRGERKLCAIFDQLRPDEALRRVTSMRTEHLGGLRQPLRSELEQWFKNLNTPDELLRAEMLVPD